MSEETGGVEAAASPMIAGTFAIYEDGKGGMVLVTDTDQHGTIRKRIPAALVKMVSGRFSQLFGGGKDGVDEYPAG